VSRAEQRRQAREEGGSDMKKFYLLFGAVAAIGVGVVGYNVGSGVFGSAVSTPVEVEGLDDLDVLAEMARGVTKGDEQSEVTVVEFGDYQCPACGVWQQQVKPLVEQSLVETGKAKFVFYDFPLTSVHPNAFLAARAARCAEDQGKFWEYHDELFRQQVRWSAEPSPAGSFEDYAGNVGIDRGDFASCLNSDRHAALVSANMQLGNVMGVGSTPTILVNVRGQPTRRVAGDFQSISQTIETLLAEGSESN
jgi:protein-disulfide isomerase